MKKMYLIIDILIKPVWQCGHKITLINFHIRSNFQLNLSFKRQKDILMTGPIELSSQYLC